MAPSRMFVLQDQELVVSSGKSAHSHIIRLMNSRRKGLKRTMTKVLWLCWKKKLARKRICHRWMSQLTGWKERWWEIGTKFIKTSIFWCTSIGLRVSGHDTDEVYSPEGHWHAEADPTCEVHKGYCTSYQIRDQNPSLGCICPGEPHERGPNAPKFEDRSHEETEWQQQGAREAAWKLAKNVFKLKEHQRATFFSSPKNEVLACINSETWGKRMCRGLRNVNAHDQQKRTWVMLEMDTLTKSCSPMTVITANGEVQTHEEATVYVKELGKFLTMKVLENTPAVLSLRKLCNENGYSYEWINGQKPHLIKDGIRMICNTEKLRSYCGFRLVKFFLGIFINFTDTLMKQESHSSLSSSSSPSSPAADEISVRETEDAPHSDISPVPVSELVDDSSGRPDEDQANKIPQPNKKETAIKRGNPCDSEIPEWLEEFREDLVDDEIPLQGCSHASSSHDASLEPTTKRREDLGKHSVYTHFPQDQNWTKITRAACRRCNGEAAPQAKFGDLITADHKVLSDNCESRNNHRYAVVVQDLATQCIQEYPCKTKTSHQRSLQKFLEPERKPKVMNTDNSLEFGKACEDLSWNDCTSTPHWSETNGIAERAVRRVSEPLYCNQV